MSEFFKETLVTGLATLATVGTSPVMAEKGGSQVPEQPKTETRQEVASGSLCATHTVVGKEESFWTIAARLWGGNNAQILENMRKLQVWNDNKKLKPGDQIQITATEKYDLQDGTVKIGKTGFDLINFGDGNVGIMDRNYFTMIYKNVKSYTLSIKSDGSYLLILLDKNGDIIVGLDVGTDGTFDAKSFGTYNIEDCFSGEIANLFAEFKGDPNFVITKEGDFQISGNKVGDHTLYGADRKKYYYVMLKTVDGGATKYRINKKDNTITAIETENSGGRITNEYSISFKDFVLKLREHLENIKKENWKDLEEEIINAFAGYKTNKFTRPNYEDPEKLKKIEDLINKYPKDYFVRTFFEEKLAELKK